MEGTALDFLHHDTSHHLFKESDKYSDDINILTNLITQLRFITISNTFPKTITTPFEEKISCYDISKHKIKMHFRLSLPTIQEEIEENIKKRKIVNLINTPFKKSKMELLKNGFRRKSNNFTETVPIRKRKLNELMSTDMEIC